MLKVQFPDPDFKIRMVGKGEEIYDAIRKKWVVLTPEEWVRQNVVSWLITVQQIPPALIAIERAIMVGETRRRFDIVVYSKTMQPHILVECKSMDVALTEKVLQQVLGYYSSLPASIVIVSNGHHTYAWKVAEQQMEMLSTLPVF